MLSEQEAQKLAEKALRFEIGTMPHLGDLRYSDECGEYVAQICISYPRNDGDELTFDKSEAVGEIVVDEDTEDVWYTPTGIIADRIAEIRDRSEDERRTRYR